MQQHPWTSWDCTHRFWGCAGPLGWVLSTSGLSRNGLGWEGPEKTPNHEGFPCQHLAELQHLGVSRTSALHWNPASNKGSAVTPVPGANSAPVKGVVYFPAWICLEAPSSSYWVLVPLWWPDQTTFLMLSWDQATPVSHLSLHYPNPEEREKLGADQALNFSFFPLCIFPTRNIILSETFFVFFSKLFWVWPT